LKEAGHKTALIGWGGNGDAAVKTSAVSGASVASADIRPWGCLRAHQSGRRRENGARMRRGKFWPELHCRLRIGGATAVVGPTRLSGSMGLEHPVASGGQWRAQVWPMVRAGGGNGVMGVAQPRRPVRTTAPSPNLISVVHLQISGHD
jgi:hypothetical protein